METNVLELHIEEGDEPRVVIWTPDEMSFRQKFQATAVLMHEVAWDDEDGYEKCLEALVRCAMSTTTERE